MFLSGWASASRLTRLSSVPTTHFVPAGAAAPCEPGRAPATMADRTGVVADRAEAAGRADGREPGDARAGHQHLRHARDLRGLGGGRLRVFTRDQHGYVAQRRDRRHGLGRRVPVQPVLGHLGQQQHRHQITPAALSFDTSSSTEATLTPALPIVRAW